MTRMVYVKKHRYIREYLTLRVCSMKKNRTEFRQKVKIKIIYNAIVVYFHDITFGATH